MASLAKENKKCSELDLNTSFFFLNVFCFNKKYTLKPHDPQKKLCLFVAILKIGIPPRACFHVSIDYKPCLKSSLFNHVCLSIFKGEYVPKNMYGQGFKEILSFFKAGPGNQGEKVLKLQGFKFIPQEDLAITIFQFSKLTALVTGIFR